jgi:hypothetical protein
MLLMPNIISLRGSFEGNRRKVALGALVSYHLNIIVCEGDDEERK